METIYLNQSKQVLASEAYQPAAVPDLVGRSGEARMIAAAWIGGEAQPPLAPLLVGDPGVGKNRLVYELARHTKLQLYILQGHEDITAEDMACAVRFSDAPGRTMDYVLSPLITAMVRGGICFIDEIGKIRPRALALLASVLDERRYIDSTLLGERVHAHPRFRFVAATNTGETHALPEFIRSRLRPVIEIGYPAREEINRIVARQAAQEPDLERLLDLFWELFGTLERPPTPRDALQLFALAASLRDYDRSAATSCQGGNGSSHRLDQHDWLSGAFPIGAEHLGEAFRQLFRQETA